MTILVPNISITRSSALGNPPLFAFSLAMLGAQTYPIKEKTAPKIAWTREAPTKAIISATMTTKGLDAIASDTRVMAPLAPATMPNKNENTETIKVTTKPLVAPSNPLSTIWSFSLFLAFIPIRKKMAKHATVGINPRFNGFAINCKLNKLRKIRASSSYLSALSPSVSLLSIRSFPRESFYYSLGAAVFF